MLSFTSYVTLLITPRNVTDNSHRFYGHILYVVRDTVDHAKQHEIRQPPYIQPDARDAVRNSSDCLSGVRSFTSYVTLLITPRNVTDNSHRFYGQILYVVRDTVDHDKQHEIRQPPYIQPDARDAVRNSSDFLSGVRSFTSYVTLLITRRNVTDNSHRFYGQILYVVRDTVDHDKQHEIRQPPYIQPDARDAVRNSSDFLSGVRSFTSYVTLLITPRNVTNNSHRFYGQVLVALYSTAFDLLSCARFFTSYVTLWITTSNMKYDSRHIYSQTHVMLYATAVTSCQVSDPSHHT
ncbi:hypothetical protein GN244_ATG20792 [Phytophthora infestans]|uniref:Uncharacterized protein n=1 Tax=Phytophthora infestans TaxID=4787 RepID=A0A833S1H6_PHYIN|nr:hypothetical protein GN244_ATG20792 [Phytophthora infestans]